MMTFEEKIKKAWGHTPAVVSVKEITRKSQLPKWENCKKNEVHVGVIRRQKGDRLLIVKHKICHELDMKIEAEDLSDRELFLYGFYPNGEQKCSKCGEFASRINIGSVCVDCGEKKQ